MRIKYLRYIACVILAISISRLGAGIRSTINAAQESFSRMRDAIIEQNYLNVSDILSMYDSPEYNINPKLYKIILMLCCKDMCPYKLSDIERPNIDKPGLYYAITNFNIDIFNLILASLKQTSKLYYKNELTIAMDVILKLVINYGGLTAIDTTINSLSIDLGKYQQNAVHCTQFCHPHKYSSSSSGSTFYEYGNPIYKYKKFSIIFEAIYGGNVTILAHLTKKYNLAAAKHCFMSNVEINRYEMPTPISTAIIAGLLDSESPEKIPDMIAFLSTLNIKYFQEDLSLIYKKIKADMNKSTYQSRYIQLVNALNMIAKIKNNHNQSSCCLII